MDSPVPPDPYAALGVPKNADAATIKSTYRKLVLKCHPDKVTDESLKQQKQDEFHKIQSAYEIIGDEEKRATYDAQIRLAELRKEKLERTGAPPSRSASYDYRAPTSSAAFGAQSTPRYEERKPTRPHDDDKYFDDRSSSRKYDGYEAYSKRTTPRAARTDREPIRVSRTSDKVKSDHKKTKDREERRDRSTKYSYAEEDDSPDEKARYEREYRKRSEEARFRKEQDDLREKQEADDHRARKDAAEARRRADEERRISEEATPRSARRSTSRDREDRFNDERQRKLSDMENHVKNYISTSRNAESRPQASRTSSSRDVRDYYDIRPRRPDAPRRSSARPRDRDITQPISSGREGHRKGSSIPEIVEWEDDRSPPSFRHSVSSPADIKTVPRATPQRAQTMESGHERRRDPSPTTPVFRRSETMPSGQSATRRKESTPTRPSTLRNESILPTESRRSSPEAAYPSIPSAQPSGATKKYYYATPGGGVTLAPEDIGLPAGHRTILREPETRRRQRSPSPSTSTRTVPAPTSSSRYPAAAPRVVPVRIPPPPLGRSATMSASPERRPSLDTGRGPSLYGELDSDYLRRERAKNQTSFAHDQINWAKKYGPEHVEYTRGRGEERDYPKPTLRRNETYVY